MFIKLAFFIGIIFFSFSLYSQPVQDTLSHSDTLVVRSYNKNGKVKWERIYLNGIFVAFKKWYYNNEVYGYRIENYADQPKIIRQTEYFADGKLRIEGQLVKGKKHGVYKTFYQNGNSQCICNYKSGKQDSLQLVHFENGNVQVASNYKNGKLHGTSTYYFENAQLWTERIYHDGKLWNVVSLYDNKGQPVEKGTLTDGNGTLVIYNETGNRIAEEYYVEGKMKKKK